MRWKVICASLGLVLCGGALGFWWTARAHGDERSAGLSYRTAWSPQAAAEYLDAREVWWQGWPAAKMDHGTICVSCHTVVPYAMMRSALGRQLRETEMPAPEKVLFDNVEKRVAGWSEMTPFYSDADSGPGKTAQSHATEALLNAVILTSYDTQQGQLRPVTRKALDEAWALEEKQGDLAGGWKWQDFQLAPWESAESAYQGAAWLMLTVLDAPDGYAGESQVQPHMQLLEQYLRRLYGTQPLVNQLYILWLSRKAPELLTAAERDRLVGAVRGDQRPDGGWSLDVLDARSQRDQTEWRRLKDRAEEMATPAESDGYATGLVVIALEQAGIGREDASVRRGVEWLRRHQEQDGSWWAHSLNGKRDPESDVGKFMRDAATAYAVMALEENPPQLAKR
jgi:squalene-hopene/tetraprenyl-beta-curcumene cyclase